jgi:hypothetical protein
MDMKTDVEDLLRDGMERFTDGVRAPAGLASTAARLRRRRRTIRGAVARGTAAVTAAAAVVMVTAAGGSASRAPATVTHTHEVAYVVSRVKAALSTENLVFQGKTTGTYGPSATWAYGHRWRWEEFTGKACRHALPSGDCTHRGGSERYLATGTARAGGKLTGAHVTYYNREYSLSPITAAQPTSACSRTARLEMGGPATTPGDHWADFINATLACGAAKVTGHVWISGVQTIQITGKPITVRLPPGEAKAVREKWARVGWTLYVDPAPYLPVRITGWNATFGGPAPRTSGSEVMDVQWLKPTAANTAKALVTIPPGFRRVSSPANQ